MTDLWTGEQRAGLTVAGVDAWLHGHGLAADVPVYPGPDIREDDPRPLLIVTLTAGAGYLLEQILDAPGFQIRTIGPQGDYATAERLAYNVDGALTSEANWPTSINGLYAPWIHRTGGAPAPLEVDDADRTHFVCTYIAGIAPS